MRRSPIINYVEYTPSKSVDTFVHRIWYFEQKEPSTIETVVPDGRPELIIHIGEPYEETPSGKIQPRALFAGQLTEPLIISPRGRTAFWGVRFRPDGARSFLGYPLHEATNKRVDLTNRDKNGLAELLKNLSESGCPQEKCTAIEKFVARSVGRAPPDPIVRHAVEKIVLDFSARIEHRTAERQFQRRFKREVGVSMKTFKAIRRFRSVFDRIDLDENESWVERSLAAGYFDQPQLSRDFSRFLGMSPKQWIRQNMGLGKVLGAHEG